MVACCSVVTLRIGSEEHQQKIENHVATTWMAALSNARQRQTDFAVVTTQEREGILDTFARLQAGVACIQRDVMVDFDARVAAINKQFVTELASLEVLVNQAVVGKGDCALLNTWSNQDELADVPRFVQVPLENIQSILEACWSVVTTAELRPSLTREIVNLRKARIVVGNLSKISGIVGDALKVAGDYERNERHGAFRRLGPFGYNFQGKLLETYEDVDFQIFGVAVNNDASLLAASNYSRCTVSVYRLPNMRKLATLGSKGSDRGQFNKPLRLCFTPYETLLVADSDNYRVQEVTMRGDHVRFLQRNDAISSRVMHVTCSAEVIVASYLTGISCFCLFDMQTGNLLRSFAPGQVTQFWDITMTFDGESLLIADGGKKKRLSVFGLDGKFLRTLGDVSSLESPCSIAELPDGRFLVSQIENSQLAIVEDKGTPPTFVVVDAPHPAENIGLVTYANGFVFRWGQNFVQILC